MRKLLSFIILSLCLSSCGEYQRVLKSRDPQTKYEYAKRAYDEGKFVQAASVLQEIVGSFRGTEKAEETLFMLGMCNFENKDYMN
ncbi:MAG: tetratricopeptide repeat protein, partial [Muribaculaceae bacterium]|nr:tetratricopeptide repeat protein [Muribaculaceae bacterium]